jgi:hypothetical protein
MPVDIESIKVDDIIVYGSIAALAYMPNPECIWIGHRVTEKYQKNGQWWFRTKGDNNPETDPWEVPYYWVTGIVINIEQTKPITTPEETPIEPTQTDSQTFLRIEIVLPIAGSLSLGALIMTMLHLRDRKQANMLRKANIHSCYTCQQYETQSTQRLVSVSGGWKLIGIPQFSRGLCSFYNQEIHAFHRRKCGYYQPKNLKELID